MSVSKSILQQKIDTKTKPIGSLGRLEDIAVQIGEIQKTLDPKLCSPSIIVFAGDHGIANEGVSAYPQEVTYQMVMNFLNGGAAINVFCEQHDLDMYIVDSGVNHIFDTHEKLIDKKMAMGTNSFLAGDAMSEQQMKDCLLRGSEVVAQIHQNGCNIIGFGEMGIGNTSSASLILSSLFDIPIDKLVGRGTGVDDEKLNLKRSILEQVKNFHEMTSDPLKILQKFGGFEIAQMCGAFLEAKKKNMTILVDGYIATAAYSVALKCDASLAENTIFTHRSNELGHEVVLNSLNVKPLLNLGLRLGEGTGCALAYPLIESSVNFLNKMASFDSASVTSKDS